MNTPNNDVILTRYLYILDEVLLTLQDTILKGNDFDEVVFWIGEILYSGFFEKFWQFIFSFNYNFCAIRYPKYEKKLYNLYKEFNQELNKLKINNTTQKEENLNNTTFISFNVSDEQLSICINAASILFNSNKNYIVFDKWEKEQKTIDKVYIGRTPMWLKNLNIDKKYYSYLRSIENENFKNIAFYLKIKKFDIQELYNITVEYFKSVKKIPIKANKTAITDLPYKNKEHIIMTIICYMLIDEQNIEKRSIFVNCDPFPYITQLKRDNQPLKIAYKTLPEKYRYSISTRIGCFSLSRNIYAHYQEIKKIYWYYWRYYAYKCPLWRERFNKYNISINNLKYDILFKDYNQQEEFDENYYYETDEQKKEIQDKSVPYIPTITKEMWKKLIM